MKKIGYLRISTLEQRPDRQVLGLEPMCDELHIERLSAVRRRRPIYESIIARLNPGDAFVVWDLDRAWRSLRDALNEIDKLQSRGIELRIVGLQLDFSSPGGMLAYSVLSACAEFERRMLAQRTREGLAAARQRGVRLGRPRKLTDGELTQATIMLRSPGTTITSVAKKFDVAPWSLTRSMRRRTTTEDHEANDPSSDELQTRSETGYGSSTTTSPPDP